MPEVQPRNRGWDDLLSALKLLEQGAGPSEDRPLHCEHDVLYVRVYPSEFDSDEIAQLKEWGFHVDNETNGFVSQRFGSA